MGRWDQEKGDARKEDKAKLAPIRDAGSKRGMAQAEEDQEDHEEEEEEEEEQEGDEGDARKEDKANVTRTRDRVSKHSSSSRDQKWTGLEAKLVLAMPSMFSFESGATVTRVIKLLSQSIQNYST